MGFNGVVITDSLIMQAMTANYSTEHVAVLAVQAGVDLLLMPAGVERTIAAIEKAVESGEITESRIDESVRRIIALKVARGIMEI
jgi:beta-N-acetylhexosaminidase